MAFLVVACTKQVGLYTEVEFELTQEYQNTGYLQEAFPTTLSVIPEEDLEGYSYSFTYEVESGNGYFLDTGGERLPTGENIPFNPLSTSMFYEGTDTGEHLVKIVASDNFGFTEETELRYVINAIPVVWTASASATQVELGNAVAITLTLENGADGVDVSFESKYTLASGSGTLVGVSMENIGISDDFTPIAPHTYALSFTPDALGMVELIFDLRDGNGQELRASVIIEVVEEVLEISVLPKTASIAVGSTQQLMATIPLNNTIGQGVLWSSNNVAVATVNEDGSVTAISAGEATITATSADNISIADTAVITVSNSQILVANITVNSSSYGIIEGQIEQFTVTVGPMNASNATVLWSSSNPEIAMVDESTGLVTAVSAGMTNIIATATDGSDVSGDKELTVTAAQIPVTSITVVRDRSSILDKETEQFSVVVAPTNASNNEVTWSSSNVAIATVNPFTGLVTAVSAGTTIIKAVAADGSDIEGTAGITVTASPILVTDITVTSMRASIRLDETENFTAEVIPTDASNSIVNWSSSNTSVATVNASSGLVTAVSAGTANIIATASDGSGISGLKSLAVTANQMPTANAGSDRTIMLPTSAVTLFGSGNDVDGTVITYQWSQVSSNLGAPANIVSPNSPQTNVTGLSTGIYEFKLIVTDDAMATASATVTITVDPGNSVVFSDENFYATGSEQPDADENFSVSGIITISGASAIFTVSATLLVATTTNTGEPANLDNIITTTFTIDGVSYNVFKAQAGTEETETPPFPEGTYTYSINVERQAIGNIEASWRGAVTAAQ